MPEKITPESFYEKIKDASFQSAVPPPSVFGTFAKEHFMEVFDKNPDRQVFIYDYFSSNLTVFRFISWHMLECILEEFFSVPDGEKQQEEKDDDDAMIADAMDNQDDDDMDTLASLAQRNFVSADLSGSTIPPTPVPTVHIPPDHQPVLASVVPIPKPPTSQSTTLQPPVDSAMPPTAVVESSEAASVKDNPPVRLFDEDMEKAISLRNSKVKPSSSSDPPMPARAPPTVPPKNVKRRKPN